MYHIVYGAGVSETILGRKEDKYATYCRRNCCTAYGETSG